MVNAYDAEEVFRVAKDIFCDGIYVKSSNHRCGWDFLTFEYLDDFDEDYKFEAEDFNSKYHTHEYEGFTLNQILKTLGMDGWCFELSGVDYLK